MPARTVRITVIVNKPAGQSSSDFQTLLGNTQQTLQKTPDVASVWPPSVEPGRHRRHHERDPDERPAVAARPRPGQQPADDVLPAVSAPTYLTGTTVGNVDFTERTVQRLPWLIGAVVLLSLLLLTAAFRSLAIGIKAAVMNLLSVGAAYGVVVAVFQWGWGSSLIGMDQKVPIPAFVPMLMFAIVFGLSMDYEVFLLSRVHEAYVRNRRPTSQRGDRDRRAPRASSPRPRRSWSWSSRASWPTPIRSSRCSRSAWPSRC